MQISIRLYARSTTHILNLTDELLAGGNKALIVKMCIEDAQCLVRVLEEQL